MTSFSPSVVGRHAAAGGRLVEDRHLLVVGAGPIAEIDGVGAPFEDAAAVEIEVAAPAAVDVLPVVRPPRGRAEPQVPVDLVPGRLGLGGKPVVVGGRMERVGVDGRQFAELAVAAEIGGEDEVGHAAPLRAGLIDAAVAPHGVGQGLALGDGHRAGLFAVDVLARLGRVDRGHRVPAVAGGDQHGVDVLAGEHLAEVAVGRPRRGRICFSALALTLSRQSLRTSAMATNCMTGSSIMQSST